jgi:hypothetical protein
MPIIIWAQLVSSILILLYTTRILPGQKLQIHLGVLIAGLEMMCAEVGGPRVLLITGAVTLAIWLLLRARRAAVTR